jgi:nitrogen fixation protein NifU and related proteins
MDEIYHDQILDHYERPRHFGSLAHPDGSYRAKNPLCGDAIAFEIQLSHDRRHIADIAFQGHGCVISQVAASMLAESVVGKSLADVEALDQRAMVELLGVQLTATRLKCALLGLRALKMGLYSLEAHNNEPRLS